MSNASSWYLQHRTVPATTDRTVPCNGCTLCCHNDLVRLLPGDDETRYLTEPHPLFQGQRMLAHKPNGDCIYLNEFGCGIHGYAPRQCREMDCRVIASRVTWTQARKIAHFNMRVWRRGKDLLKQTEIAQ